MHLNWIWHNIMMTIRVQKDEVLYMECVRNVMARKNSCKAKNKRNIKEDIILTHKLIGIRVG